MITPSWAGPTRKQTEQGTTSVHKFPIFCNNFPKLSKNQLFICCMSVGLCQSVAKGKGKKEKNKNKKTNKNKKNKFMKVTKIRFLGVRNFVFFCFLFFWFFVFVFWVFCFFKFFGFLVSCFLVRCWFFERLAKQHKSEGPRPHSLPVLPL